MAKRRSGSSRGAARKVARKSTTNWVSRTSYTDPSEMYDVDRFDDTFAERLVRPRGIVANALTVLEAQTTGVKMAIGAGLAVVSYLALRTTVAAGGAAVEALDGPPSTPRV